MGSVILYGLWIVAFLYITISALSLFALVFKCMHLADAFIQRDLQGIQGSVYILSVYVFPGTHDLGFASASPNLSSTFLICIFLTISLFMSIASFQPQELMWSVPSVPSCRPRARPVGKQTCS